jgi:hypothetical protein
MLLELEIKNNLQELLVHQFTSLLGLLALPDLFISTHLPCLRLVCSTVH